MADFIKPVDNGGCSSTSSGHGAEINMVTIVPPAKWSIKELVFLVLLGLMTLCWVWLLSLTIAGNIIKTLEFVVILALVTAFLAVITAPEASTWIFYQIHTRTGLPMFTKKARFIMMPLTTSSTTRECMNRPLY